MERTKIPNLRNGSKGRFEPGLTWLRLMRVRRSTAELPRSTVKGTFFWHKCRNFSYSLANTFTQGYQRKSGGRPTICHIENDNHSGKLLWWKCRYDFPVIRGVWHENVAKNKLLGWGSLHRHACKWVYMCVCVCVWVWVCVPGAPLYVCVCMRACVRARLNRKFMNL